MKVSQLVYGNKYNATCFNGDACVFVEVIEYISEECSLVAVIYRGIRYIASSYQLYEN